MDTVPNLPPSEQIGGKFTPPKPQSHPNMFGGVMVRNFPKDCDFGTICEFLVENGLPQRLCETVEVKENGKIYVRSLKNDLCHELIRNITGKNFKNRNLICNGIVPVTPLKDQQNSTL